MRLLAAMPGLQREPGENDLRVCDELRAPIGRNLSPCWCPEIQFSSEGGTFVVAACSAERLLIPAAHDRRETVWPGCPVFARASVAQAMKAIVAGLHERVSQLLVRRDQHVL